MSRSWNGSSLVTELSAFLGDTSAAFQTRVLGWLNDVISEISVAHDWSFHKVVGQKKLTAGQELQSLEITPPGAPSVAIAAGGSLTDASVYSVLVTFGQENGVETKAGAASANVTASGANRTVNITSIPVSTETLVTERNLYLKKDSGKYYYHSTIFDNTSASASIDSDTTETIEPPDFPAIRKIIGAPWCGSPNLYLAAKDEDQIRQIAGGQFSSGTPEYFSPKGEDSIVLYPKPSTSLDLFFNYYRSPFRLYNAEDSYPDLPFNLKPVLRAGVVALGYEYRDRAGADVKRAKYEQMLDNAGSNYENLAQVSYAVRDVSGNVDGFVIGD
jgi:hypothetical protein